MKTEREKEKKINVSIKKILQKSKVKPKKKVLMRFTFIKKFVSISCSSVKAKTLNAKNVRTENLIMTINQMKWEIKVDPKQLFSPCFNIDFGSLSINLLSIIHVPLSFTMFNIQTWE